MSRVAIVYHSFPHYRAGVIRALVKSNLNPSFIGDNVARDGIPLFEFDETINYERCRCYRIGKLVFQPNMLAMLFRGRYESAIFLSNPYHITTWIGAILCRIRGTKTIFWGHGFIKEESCLRQKMRATFYRLADAHLFYGWRAKHKAIELGFRQERVHVVFNSLDYESQVGNRRDGILMRGVGLPVPAVASNFSISCISRLTPECRYDELFEAILVARKAIAVPIFVHMIGGGAELDRLRQKARSLEIAVEFYGPVYDERRISEIVGQSSVTVSPGKIGLTAIHSLMYGTPVITHNDFSTQMPEVEAVIEGKTGWFFEKGSVLGLANALVRAANAMNMREQIRAHCYRMIDEIYNPDNQVRIIKRAIDGELAEAGDDAFRIFNSDEKAD